MAVQLARDRDHLPQPADPVITPREQPGPETSRWAGRDNNCLKSACFRFIAA